MNILKFTSRDSALRVLGIPLFLLSTWGFGWASTDVSDVKVRMDYWAPYYRPALAIVPDGT